MTSGNYNISVQINNLGGTYNGSNYLNQNISYLAPVTVHVQDIQNNNLSNVNITVYSRTLNQTITSGITDTNGNFTFSGLATDNYSLSSYANWMQYGHQFIQTNNISYPSIGPYLTIPTNITLLTIHTQDVALQPAQNVSISIDNNKTTTLLASQYTGSNGNITFNWLTGNYDILFNYSNYGQLAFQSQVYNYSLTGPSFLTQNVNLTLISVHLYTSTSNQSLVGAQVQFYNWSNSLTDYGNLIGSVIADSNGNASFYWSSAINYSVRVNFYSQYDLVQGSPFIGTPQNYAMNYTNLITYQNQTIEVNLNGVDLSQFKTQLTLYNQLPISYNWNDVMNFTFLFNVTLAGGNPSLIGPHWANYTNLLIQDSNYNTVFSGPLKISLLKSEMRPLR